MAVTARPRSGRPLAVALLLIAVAALGYLDWQLYTTPLDVAPLAPATGVAGGKDRQEVDLATALDDKPLIVFQATLERPLFHADRKPIERKENTEAPAPALNTDMQLIGIVKADDEPGRALIRFSGEPTGKWVGEGETVNGWHLRTVKSFSVLVEGNGQSHELKLPAVARTVDDGGNAPPEPPRSKGR